MLVLVQAAAQLAQQQTEAERALGEAVTGAHLQTLTAAIAAAEAAGLVAAPVLARAKEAAAALEARPAKRRKGRYPRLGLR